MSTATNVATAAAITLFGVQILITRAAYGHLFPAAVATMARVTIRGPKILLLSAALTGIVVAALPSVPSWLPPIPQRPLAAVSLLALNGACLPPAVLFLGVSRRDGWQLVGPIQRAVSPLKFIHLLDSSLELNPAIRWEIRRSKFRVWRHADWQHVVRRLAGVVPIVIVDARAATPSLLYEIEQIIHHGFDGRTFFLCDHTGRCRALEGLKQIVQAPLHVLAPNELIALLKGIGWYCVLHESVDLSSAVASRIVPSTRFSDASRYQRHQS